MLNDRISKEWTQYANWEVRAIKLSVSVLVLTRILNRPVKMNSTALDLFSNALWTWTLGAFSYG